MSIGLSAYESLETLPPPGAMGDRYSHLRSRIPVGRCGKWSVERFTVDAGLGLLRLMRDGRGTPLGEYTRLCRNGNVIMSDTNAELDDLRTFLNRAMGRVLIHGLGLGIAVCGALAKPDVTSVEVVELDVDVISLVGLHLHDDRLTIRQGDCLNIKPSRGERWNVVWHDIWDNICSDNLEEMATLKRRFSRRCDWQGCWAEQECRRLNARGW